MIDNDPYSKLDDYSTKPILDTLTPEELEIWCLEAEVYLDVTYIHGNPGNIWEMVENEIRALGIE